MAQRTSEGAVSLFTDVKRSPRTVKRSPRKTSEHLTDKEFKERYGYGWDYCIIFPTDGKPTGTELPPPTALCKRTVRSLEAAGLQTKCFYSFANDEIYCKIRAPLSRLEVFADFLNWKVLLNRHRLKEVAEGGNPKEGIAPFYINPSKEICKYSPYEYIYGKYDTSKELQPLYELEEGSFDMSADENIKHPFRNTLRLHLILGIIKARRDKSGAQLKPRNMLYDGEIKGFFPLHNEVTKARLEESWTWKKWPWDLPFNQIRNYFGEQIGMYFQFLAHYTKWVLMPSILGLIVFVIMSTQGRAEGPLVAVYCIFITLWAILMLEFWKRKQAKIQLFWGMKGIEKEQPDRPEFKGEPIASPVDGSSMLFFAPSKRRKILFQSRSVITSSIIVVLTCLAAVITLRKFLLESNHTFGRSYGSYIASFLNGVTITLLNLVYRVIAIWMTDKENHRTDHSYQDSLIGKLFMFQFCNSYSSFFYIAFLQEKIDGACDSGSCMETLMKNLIIIFLVQLSLGNIVDIVVPFFKHKRKLQIELNDVMGTHSAKSASAIEYEFTLDVYDDIMGTLMDYLDVAVQFGYLTLFVAAFPLTPLLALLNTYASIHADAYRLLHMMQRPVPQPAQDIGTWQVILTILAIISVVTNSALLCFIMEGVLDGYSTSTRLWAFVIIQYVIFTMMYAIQLTVPDIPHDVRIQHQRTAFLVSKLIDRISDENEEAGFELKEDSNFQLHVHETDDVLAQKDLMDKITGAGADATRAINKAGKELVDDTNDALAKAGHGIEAAAEKVMDGIGLPSRPKTASKKVTSVHPSEMIEKDLV